MDRTALQGLVIDGSDPGMLREAVEAACDYRGDITLALRGGERVTGYLFDRRLGPTPAQSAVRIIPAGAGGKRSITLDQIVSVEFSGKDTAAGKTWENWVRKYVRTKLAGGSASIEAERLE